VSLRIILKATDASKVNNDPFLRLLGSNRQWRDMSLDSKQIGEMMKRAISILLSGFALTAGIGRAYMLERQMARNANKPDSTQKTIMNIWQCPCLKAFNALGLGRAVSFISLAVCLSMSVSAETFYVTESLDTTNVTSLRGAIIAANSNGGANLIVLTNGLYELTIPGPDESASLTGDLNVTSGNLTIVASSSSAVIDATGLGDRVVTVSSNAQLTLSGLVITGGSAPGGMYGVFANEDGESAGAIYNEGSLFMENCVVTNNLSGAGNLPLGNVGPTAGGDGGSIYNSGVFIMLNCTVGRNASGSPGGNGGGIFNLGVCELDNCLICSNSSGSGADGEGFGSSGGSGGGIFNSGEMTLNNCTVIGNNTGDGADAGPVTGTIMGVPPGPSGGAGGDGGGIYNIGVLSLYDCTVAGNMAGHGGSGYPGGGGGAGGTGGSGGGICSVGTLTLNSCTVGDNGCGNGGNGGAGVAFLSYAGNGGAGGNGGNGGGIFGAGATALITSTIAGNSGGWGGVGGDGEAGILGVYDVETNGTVVFVILSGNDGIGGNGGIGGAGGIFASSSENSTATIQNVIVALDAEAFGGAGGLTENTNGSIVLGTAATSGSPDLAGQFVSNGHNLIGQTDGSNGITNGANNDLAGLDPMILPLSNNGGSTPTFALLPGSPAIDAGDDSLLGPPANLTEDQRGQARKSGARVDIGAFEYNGILNGMVLSPLLRDSEASSGGLQFWFNGASGLSFSIWASTNLSTWTEIGPASEVSHGWFVYQDSDATNYNHRFYQVRYP
jgi:hypothetical protein